MHPPPGIYRRGIRCDTCGQFGHSYARCTSQYCTRCGRNDHEVSRCRAEPSLICSKCGKKGHIYRACPQYPCRWCKQRGHRSIACPNKPFIQHPRLTQRERDVLEFRRARQSQTIQRPTKYPTGHDSDSGGCDSSSAVPDTAMTARKVLSSGTQEVTKLSSSFSAPESGTDGIGNIYASQTTVSGMPSSNIYSFASAISPTVAPHGFVGRRLGPQRSPSSQRREQVPCSLIVKRRAIATAPPSGEALELRAQQHQSTGQERLGTGPVGSESRLELLPTCPARVRPSDTAPNYDHALQSWFESGASGVATVQSCLPLGESYYGFSDDEDVEEAATGVINTDFVEAAPIARVNHPCPEGE